MRIETAMSASRTSHARFTRIAAATIPALALALPLGAAGATASPMNHYSYPASDFGSIPCETRTYTFTTGTFTDLTKSTDQSSIPAAHITAVSVRAVDQDGVVYRVQGIENYDDAKGRLVAKIQFLSPGGGRVDSVNIVYRDGGHAFDFGTCHFE
jgi:hypothetical protein